MLTKSDEEHRRALMPDEVARLLDAIGAMINERMILRGHSRKGNITLGTYTHADPARLYEIIEQLPDYQWPQKQAAMMTDTDNRPVEVEAGSKILSFSYQPKARKENSMELGGISNSDTKQKEPLQDDSKVEHRVDSPLLQRQNSLH
jgi:hypothetical protein